MLKFFVIFLRRPLQAKLLPPEPFRPDGLPNVRQLRLDELPIRTRSLEVELDLKSTNALIKCQPNPGG